MAAMTVTQLWQSVKVLLEQDAEKASLLVKARRLAVAANSNAVAPSCLQARVARGQPLPRLALMPLADEDEEGDEGRKFRTTKAFMCGVGREGMPRDVFRVVMDLVMPSWDPLRRNVPGLDRGGQLGSEFVAVLAVAAVVAAVAKRGERKES